MTPIMVSVPLDIPDVRILSTEVNAQQELVITVASTQLGIACRRCGEVLHKLLAQCVSPASFSKFKRLYHYE